MLQFLRRITWQGREDWRIDSHTGKLSKNLAAYLKNNCVPDTGEIKSLAVVVHSISTSRKLHRVEKFYNMKFLHIFCTRISAQYFWFYDSINPLLSKLIPLVRRRFTLRFLLLSW